jgi:hypothetical protein
LNKQKNPARENVLDFFIVKKTQLSNIFHTFAFVFFTIQEKRDVQYIFNRLYHFYFFRLQDEFDRTRRNDFWFLGGLAPYKGKSK